MEKDNSTENLFWREAQNRQIAGGGVQTEAYRSPFASQGIIIVTFIPCVFAMSGIPGYAKKRPSLIHTVDGCRQEDRWVRWVDNNQSESGTSFR